MKLVIDMSALDVEKRKMVVDYLQDNDVPITWAEHINKIQDIARLPFTGWDLAGGKPPVMAAPYGGGSRYSKERAVDIYKATAEQILTQERNSLFGPASVTGTATEAFERGEAVVLADPWLEHGTKDPKPNPFLVQRARREARGLELLSDEAFREQYMGHFNPLPNLFVAAGEELDRYGKLLECRRTGGECDTAYRHRLRLVDKQRHYSAEWADAEARRQEGLAPADPYTPEFRSGSPMQRHAQGLCPACGHTVEGSLHYIGCPRLKFD